MMRTGITRMLLGAVLLTGLLTGCKQGLGERCQVNDDCGTDLTCLLGANTGGAANGYCISTVPTAQPTSTDLATTTPADLTVKPNDLTTTPPDLAGTD